MAASRESIIEWLQEAQDRKSTHLLVVCDTFDREDYPVYCESPIKAISEYNRLNGKNMQRVMECYDMDMSIDSQMLESRAFHLPELSPKVAS